MNRDRPIGPEGLRHLSSGMLPEMIPGGEPAATSPPSQPGSPNPANMTMDPPGTEAEPEEPEIEFDWINVDEWGARDASIERRLALLRDTAAVLVLLTDGAARTRPVSGAYRKLVSILEDELRGQREELALMVLKMHKLPLPEQPDS